MSKVYKHDEEIKEENGIFLKGYKVSYYYNDQIKETYTYLNKINIQDIQESHEKERESDASESDDASLNDVSLNEEQKDEKKREQKEGIECNNINVNVKELLKAIISDSDNKIRDGLDLNATEETNKNIANINKKQIVNNLIRNKADAHAVPMKTSENKCGKEKPKLNVNKIKNIIEKSKNENRDSEENGLSIQDKIQRLIKKINNKIKAEVVKELMEYENVVENEIKHNKNNDDEIEMKMNAFYHYILNKIISKI